MSQPVKPRTFLQFIRIPLLFHKLMGHDLYAHRSNDRLRNVIFDVYYYLGFGLYNIQVVGKMFYFVRAIRSKDSLLQAINVASMISFCFVANLKQVALAINKRLFQAHMDQLESMFPKTLEQQLEYKLPYHERRMQRVMGIFAWLSLAFTSTFSMYPLFRSTIRYYLWGVPHYERIFGFYIWYPYNATATASVYWPTYVAQMQGATLAGLAFLSGDLLLVASVTQICMHFDHISKCLLELPADDGTKEAKSEAEKLRILKILVRRHAKCLELSEHLNMIFSIELLLNFLITSLTICFIGFQMIAASLEDILKFCVFLMASLVQVLVVCNYGDELIEASMRVGEAAYNQKWFDCSEQYKYMLILIIARSQKPASIRPPTFPPISFRTYMKVIGMSYQFFALLRTTYYGDRKV